MCNNMNLKERIYISGAITGTNDYMERFQEAHNVLNEHGFAVYNPALICSNFPEDATYNEFMQISFCMLDMCTKICMLPGYEQSKGAMLELQRAKEKGIEVVFFADMVCKK